MAHTLANCLQYPPHLPCFSLQHQPRLASPAFCHLSPFVCRSFHSSACICATPTSIRRSADESLANFRLRCPSGECLLQCHAFRPLIIRCSVDEYAFDQNLNHKSDQKQIRIGNSDVVVVAAPASAEQKFRDCVRFIRGIMEMSRLQNFLPSMILVFLGSWIAAGRTISVLMRSSVWITASCSALITVASMLANDIFDYRSGTDRLNGKSTPLLRGQVQPDDVELVAGCLYGAVVIGLCYLEPLNLRLLVGGAAVASYIYTPFLKKLTVVKNVVVSGVITSAILAGAMVIGGQEHLGNPTIAVALFFFLCILGREILMDVEDMVGDKAAGVKTLAVRFGGRIGAFTAGLCLAAANALLIGFLAVRANAYATAGTLSLLPLHAKVLQLWKKSVGISDYTTETVKSIKQIVEQSMIHIGLGVLLLATAA